MRSCVAQDWSIRPFAELGPYAKIRIGALDTEQFSYAQSDNLFQFNKVLKIKLSETTGGSSLFFFSFLVFIKKKLKLKQKNFLKKKFCPEFWEAYFSELCKLLKLVKNKKENKKCLLCISSVSCAQLSFTLEPNNRLCAHG